MIQVKYGAVIGWKLHYLKIQTGHVQKRELF